MTVVIPFSEAVRERTAERVPADVGCSFMTDLLIGRGTRDDYVQLLAQHFFVYSALEDAAERWSGDPVVAPFLAPGLTRLPAIEADLAFLLGDDWRALVSPLPTTRAYVDRIERASSWAGGFIAHHYTRCLGDLSGGHLIRSILQRRFGFDTNGVGFFLFAEIAEPKSFKTTYRRQLDAVAWSAAERERVLDEVCAAYRFSTELFADLAAAKAAA
ncbi:heme oxygenase [Frigoribacterium sp. PvP054]|uniref:biliverdin-producing heme oxygenase n=1 Tax=Frigoribacterium sp. PvP054 TaxID=3156438 RepID=UPI00339374F3